MSLKLLGKNPIITFIVVALICTVLIASSAPLFRLSIYGYAKSVPIQISYNEVQNYWVLSAVVDETTAFKLVLNEGATESIGDDESVKTKSEVGILIDPVQPYSKTNLVDANINYEAQTTFVPNWQKVPAFDVKDANWLTTAVYDLGVYKNNVEQTSQRIEVDYQKPKVIHLETTEGTVTVNNLGILPQGVEVPSGDLVVVYDPNGNVHVWNKADLIKMVDDWNEGRTHLRNIFTFYSWEFVWDATVNKGWLPQDVQLTHVAEVSYTEDLDSITLTYVLGAFAGDISIYVPADLADTIIVQLSDPNPDIVKVEPDPLPKIKEGESTVFWVTIENIGTRGTIYVSVSSDRYSFTPLTSSGKTMEAGEVATFKWEAYALNVEKYTKTQIKIFAQGRGGTDTYILEGEIEDVPGYTPDIPEPTETTLIIHVVDGNYEGIEEITVSIIYGASTATGMSNIDGSVPAFELGKYTGDVKIVTQETAKYPAKTEIIRVQLGTNEHTIILGAVLPWLLIVTVLVIMAVASIAIYMVMARRRKRR